MLLQELGFEVSQVPHARVHGDIVPLVKLAQRDVDHQRFCGFVVLQVSHRVLVHVLRGGDHPGAVLREVEVGFIAENHLRHGDEPRDVLAVADVVRSERARQLRGVCVCVVQPKRFRRVVGVKARR